MRLARALRAEWRRILLGMATGVYVGFAACLALMIVIVTHGDRYDDYALALVMDAVLLTSMAAGALVGYGTRRA